MSKIIILKKSITDFDTECIVNAANEHLSYGGGVCGFIFDAAGVTQLTEACNSIGYCKTGDAVITPAFNLKNNKYIIHAVGPVYSFDDLQYCRDKLYSVYKHSLELMLEKGCYSITFPLISSGIYGYPIEEAWKVAIKACDDFIKQNEKECISIFFAVINDDVYEIGDKILRDVLKKENDNPVLRLFETIAYLHKKGYEKLRIMSYISPNGMAFRCVVSSKQNFDKITGFICDKNDKASVYKKSFGRDYIYFDDGKSFENATIEDLATAFFENYPQIRIESKGKDQDYVKWFEYTLKLARNGLLPYAFSEFGYNIYKEKRIRLDNKFGFNEGYINYAPPGESDT